MRNGMAPGDLHLAANGISLWLVSRHVLLNAIERLQLESPEVAGRSERGAPFYLFFFFFFLSLLRYEFLS